MRSSSPLCVLTAITVMAIWQNRCWSLLQGNLASWGSRPRAKISGYRCLIGNLWRLLRRGKQTPHIGKHKREQKIGTDRFVSVYVAWSVSTAFRAPPDNMLQRTRLKRRAAERRRWRQPNMSAPGRFRTFPQTAGRCRIVGALGGGKMGES